MLGKPGVESVVEGRGHGRPPCQREVWRGFRSIVPAAIFVSSFGGGSFGVGSRGLLSRGHGAGLSTGAPRVCRFLRGVAFCEAFCGGAVRLLAPRVASSEGRTHDTLGCGERGRGDGSACRDRCCVCLHGCVMPDELWAIDWQLRDAVRGSWSSFDSSVRNPPHERFEVPRRRHPRGFLRSGHSISHPARCAP